MSTRNPWIKFQSLLQGKGRTVVTVLTNNGDGTSTVQLRTGEQIRVSGEQIAPPKKAMIRDGVIEYEVPAVASSVFEI